MCPECVLHLRCSNWENADKKVSTLVNLVVVHFLSSLLEYIWYLLPAAPEVIIFSFVIRLISKFSSHLKTCFPSQLAPTEYSNAFLNIERLRCVRFTSVYSTVKAQR